MPAKHTLQSLRVRGPASFDQAIRVKGHDWPPESHVDATDLDALDARKLEKTSNLSDLASAPAARANLGLGTVATLDAPAAGDAAAGQLVKGNDSRLTNARAPLAHQHAAGDINSGQLPDARIASAAAWHAKGEPNSALGALLAAAFNLTAAAGVYQDTGLSLSLPSAGTYIVTANIRGDLKISGGALAYLVARLFNATDAAALANTESLVCLTEAVNQNVQQTASIFAVVTINDTKLIKLQGMRNGSSPAWLISSFASNANGRTLLNYLKVL